MSIFNDCGHNRWRNHGAPAGNTQQQVCGKCGRVRNVKVRGRVSLFHTHSYPVGRRGTVVECGCGHQRRL